MAEGGPYLTALRLGEEEESVLQCRDTNKKLESAIFNNVSLGQWEAARAHFVYLAREPSSRENAKELLKILILEPVNFWSESPAIPSPHHLSWLALDTYNSLFPEKQEHLPDYVKELVEFRLLLYTARSITSFSSHVASWLCRYHAVHVLQIPGATPEAVPPFPTLTLSFLRDVLMVLSPAHGHTLLISLTVQGRAEYHANNEKLQLLYVDSINKCLESLDHMKSAESLETDSSYDSQYESDHHSSSGRSLTHKAEELTTLVYDLLSLVDPLPDMTKVTAKINKVFVTLLTAKYPLTSGHTIAFDSNRIYSCLLGRPNSFLITRLHDVEEYLRRNRNGEQTNKEQAVLGGSCDPESGSSLEWRNMFYEALYDHRHLLESVLESGLKVIYSGKLEELSVLISRPDLNPLHPVLLLLGWDHYPATGSGKELLAALWPSEISVQQSLLFSGCCKLAFQVELVQWCLEKARPHMQQAPSPLSIHRAGDMFKGLETHSMLFVLHHFTPLSSLDPLEVIEILKLRPRVPSLSIPLSPPPPFSRGTTPIKAHFDSDLSPCPSPLATPQKSIQTPFKHTALKPEQERDIAIFRSFYAMKLVLDAVWISIQLANGIYVSMATDTEDSQRGITQPVREGQGQKLRAVRKLELSSDAAEDSVFSPLEQAEETEEVLLEETHKSTLQAQLYRQQVLDKLQEAKITLSLVYPLNFRLEILENLFSFLFLSSEDVKPVKLGETEDSTTSHSSKRSGSSPTEAAQPTSGRSGRSVSEISVTLSSIALIRSKHGFLVNEKVSSDLLEILQDCIFELRAAKFVLSQPTELGENATLPPSAVKSSIYPTTLQQRSSKLEQYINEAKWRLQLVSSRDGIMAPARSDDQLMSSGDESGSDWTETEEEGNEGDQEGRKGRRKPKKVTNDNQEQKPEKADKADVPTILEQKLEPPPPPPPHGQKTPPFGTKPPSVMSKATLSGKISPALTIPPSPALLSTSPSVQRSVTFPGSLPTSFTTGPNGPPRLSPKLRRHTVKGKAAPSMEQSVPVRLQKAEVEDDSGEYADIEEKSPDQSKKRKKLRSRNSQTAFGKKRRRRRASDKTESGFSRNSIVCKMLASPSSLLRMCLKHANYIRANEVLKMFNMEGQFGEALVQFSEQYELVSQELSQRSRSSSPRQSSSHTPADSSGQLQSSIRVIPSSSPARPTYSFSGSQDLQVAILHATSSSNALESLHRLLAPASIHRMLFSGDELLERTAQDSTMLQVVMEHVPALVMLDVVCSSKVDGQIAKRIIELAASHCQPVLETIQMQGALVLKRSHSRWSQTHDVSLCGPFSLLQVLSDISGYFTFYGITPSSQGLPPPPHTSPHSLLTTFTHHFRVSAIMNAKMFIDSYHEARDKLEQVLGQEGQREAYIVGTITQPAEEPPTKQQQPSGNIFDELVRALRSTPRSPALSSSGKERSLMKQPSSSSLSLEERTGVSFVWQFGRYLSKLVELLMKCLESGSSATPESSLLLSVLQESPAHLIGQLVFERGIKPTRLEHLMGEFPLLQIVEVLVRCCCPHIPSHTPTIKRALPGPPTPPVVALNDSKVYDTIDDPCDFSFQLVSKLLTTLRTFLTLPHIQDNTLGPDELLQAYNCLEMKQLIAMTPLLANIDLALLDTPAKQSSFYGNVANFLYAHAIMVYLASEEEGGLSMLSGSGISMATMQSSRLVQSAYFTKVGYYIGQLGLISCYDLHHSILCRGLSPPAISRLPSLKARIAPLKPDPWCLHASSSPDPRLLYVVHNGRLSSPLPVPLDPDNFQSTLKSAESQCLASCVTIDLNKKEIIIPQWLSNNRDDFIKPIWSEHASDTTSYSTLSDLSLLKYILTSLPRERAELLSPLIDEGGRGRKLPLKIQMKRDHLGFGYNFGMKRPLASSQTGDGQSPKSVRSPKTSPKTKGKKISAREEKEKRKQSEKNKEPVAQYHFVPETLAFVNQRSPLLAALVHLLCPPPPTSGRASKTGKSVPEEKEAEEEGEGEKEEVEKGEGGGKKKLLQSLRGKQKPPFQRKSSFSYDDKVPLSPPTQPWRKQFEEIMSHFTNFVPMKQYLCARLAGFDSILPWDPPKHLSKHHRRSSLECSVSLRRLAALSPSSEELGEASGFAMQKLLDTGQVNKAVKFLSSEPAINHVQKARFLADLAISGAFVTNYSEVLALGQSGEPMKEKSATISPLALLSQLSDPELAARLTLSSLHNWPVDGCVAMLSYCVHHLSPFSHLLPILTVKLERMRAYAKVMGNCENPLPQASGQDWRATKSPWESWSQLASDSKSRPDYVLRILLGMKLFELARGWAVVHRLGQEITQQIEVDYLFVLLEGESPDPIAAQQVLDSLSDNHLTLQVCEAVLEQCTDLQTTIFILHYMLTRLAHCIHIARTHDHCNKLLGAKALLCLPYVVRHEYESLITEPMLLVEQLLVDMRIEWAGNVVRQLRTDEYISNILMADMPTLDHTPIIITEDDTRDSFSTLLMYYTAKALEFPQPVLTGSSSQSQITSLAPSAVTTRPASPIPIPSRHATLSRTISADKQATPTDHTPSRQRLSHRRRTSFTITSPMHTTREVSFEIPSAPPPKERWEPNADAPRCRVCKQVYFGMFNRRHHCRRCGRVVCAGCSSHVASIEGYERPVRICDHCYRIMQSEDTLPPMAEGYPYLGSVYPALSSSPIQHWKLLPNDPMYNQGVRREFYYERTPDTALCLALVDLMSNPRVAAAYLLDCCHSVSAQLVPDSQGRVNEEVDHYFVISLIQNLLLNAKLRFADAGDLPGVELCDTYLSRVDLLRLLVSSRWSRIPSIQELTKPDLARRVRDRLIEDDRFGLAMEVSTKCQLDTSAVWAAWGMGALKSGNFVSARNKFWHCFQVSSQSKMSSGVPNQLSLLARIVEQIELSPLAVTGRSTQHSEDWSSVIVGSMALSQKHTDDCDLDIYRFNECVYYLRSYGTLATLVAFFARHSCWTDACKYILDNNCPTDVFVEQLWVPAVKAGVIEQVQETLKTIDSSLVVWEPYLTAVCRYFTQRGLYSILYSTQLFMKDYIRAGMTCIKFFIGFSGRATTVADLYSRLHYLHTAKRHFETPLHAQQRPLERRSGRSKGHRQWEDPQRPSSSLAKSMTISELQSHISTITLQMRITTFLYQCAEAVGVVSKPLPTSVGADPSSKQQQPATLFSSGHVRAEVAIQLLIYSQDIIEGFELANEIIQIYRLPPNHIFCEASRGLAGKQRYGDIRLLLQCIQKSRFSSETLNDEIIMAAVKVLASQTRETKQVDKLVQLLTNERSKIKALIQCGKLKNAYLIAIKSRLVNEVRNISEIAEKAGQIPVRDICEKWLQQATAPPP